MWRAEKLVNILYRSGASSKPDDEGEKLTTEELLTRFPELNEIFNNKMTHLTLIGGKLR